jgi:hypothetical protein
LLKIVRVGVDYLQQSGDDPRLVWLPGWNGTDRRMSPRWLILMVYDTRGVVALQEVSCEVCV